MATIYAGRSGAVKPGQQTDGRAKERGFTLLEMLVALAIVVVVAGTVTRTLVTGKVLSTRAEREMQALEIARSALALAEARGGGPMESVRVPDGFERVVTIQPRPELINTAVPGIPAPLEIGVVVHWRDGSQMRDFRLSTLRLDAGG